MYCYQHIYWTQHNTISSHSTLTDDEPYDNGAQHKKNIRLEIVLDCYNEPFSASFKSLRL